MGEALLNPEYTQKMEAFSQQYNNAVAALNSYNWHKYGKRSAQVKAEPQRNFPNSGYPGNSGMGGRYWTPSMEALLNPEYTQKMEAFSQQYTNAVAALNSYNWHKYGKRSA